MAGEQGQDTNQGGQNGGGQGGQGGQSNQGGSVSILSMIDETGKFKEGWKETILPEDLRHREVFNSFSDVPSAMKHIAHLESMIGKKGVIVPTEKSSPSEIEAFHKALGVPEDIKGYKVSVPEELKELYSDQIMTDALTELKKAGATQKIVDTVMALDAKRMKSAIEEETARKQREFSEAQAALDKEWGQAKEQNLHLANRVISDNVENNEEKQKLLDIIGNNPMVAKFLAKVGAKVAEGKGFTDVESQIGVLTPAQAEAKMKELMATPGYLDGSMKTSNPAGYERLTREMYELAKMATPGKK